VVAVWRRRRRWWWQFTPLATEAFRHLKFLSFELSFIFYYSVSAACAVIIVIAKQLYFDKVSPSHFAQPISGTLGKLRG
jgi:hypothetical protein